MIEEKLIYAVQKHQELYDTKHENYNKLNLRIKLWSKIAEELNLRDGESAKNMWLKLRSSFRDARRRYLKQLNTSVPSSIQNPTKTWRFHKQMSFLEAYMSGGTSEKYSTEDFDINDDSYQPKPLMGRTESGEIKEVVCKIEDDSIEMQNVHNTDVGFRPLSAVEANSEDKTKKHSESPPPPSCSHSKKDKKLDIQSLLNLSLKMREERAKQRAQERKNLQAEKEAANDPLQNFFMSMYLMTKEMPPLYQHSVRNKVFQAISNAQAELLGLGISNDFVQAESQIHHEIVVKEEPGSNE